MRLSAMGDVAMIVRILQALTAENNDIKITVISRKFFEPLFSNISNVTFFAFDYKNRHKGFIGLLRLFFDLKKLKIDAFADCHNVLRSKIIQKLFALSGIKTATLDKGRADKKALTRTENKIFKQLPTMFERHCAVFESLGFDIDLTHLIFPEKAILDDRIRDLIDNKNQKLIGIAPFAQYDTKVYPLDLMEQVVNKLSENPKNKILIFGGGQSEIETINISFCNKKQENVINCAGKLSFEQELNLISNLDVMLSMDSGNAHLAANYGIKTITLWGATHPFAGFAPFNQPLENCLLSDRKLYPKLPTSIFGNKIIDGYQDAMRTISVEAVVSKVESLL